MLRYILLFTVIMLSASISRAQVGNRTITWYSNESRNLLTQDVVTHTLHFISHGDATIELVQKKMTQVFTVNSMTGNWDDPEANGMLTYSISDDVGDPGQIKIGRDAQGLFVILDLSISSRDGIKQRFNIANYTVE